MTTAQAIQSKAVFRRPSLELLQRADESFLLLLALSPAACAEAGEAQAEQSQ